MALSARAPVAPACQAAGYGGRQIAARVAQGRAAGVSSKASPALSGGGGAAALAPRSSSRSSSRAVQRLAAAPPTVAAAAPGSAGTVAVAGATGLVGGALVKQLLAEGYAVRVLTRNVVAARGKLPYPGLQFVAPAQWSAAVCGTTAVVNLAGGRRQALLAAVAPPPGPSSRGSAGAHSRAILSLLPACCLPPLSSPCSFLSSLAFLPGEPIATRWTSAIKAEVKRSRVAVTSQLAAAINACPSEQRPKVLVNSSAVGYYGNSEVSSRAAPPPGGMPVGGAATCLA